MKRTRLLALLLAVLTLCAACGNAAQTTGETVSETATPSEREPEGFEAAIAEIDESGDVLLQTTPAAFGAAGFEIGDRITVTIGSKDHEMPVGSDADDVDPGKMLCLIGDGDVRLIVNGGSFALERRIATKDESGAWQYAVDAQSVRVTLKEKGGYLGTLVKRSLVRTNKRTDYPGLTDEEFANFRMVQTRGIAAGKLYRSTSPINPSYNRSAEADAAARAAGIKTAINLTDDPADIPLYAGYADTYYAGLTVFARALETDFFTDRFRADLADALRFMAQNEPPFLVHCMEGKDRTGFLCSMLEALTGATTDEIVRDYMRSYENFYKVETDSPTYRYIAENNVLANLAKAFDLPTLDGADLSAAARAYLRGIGLTDGEIEAIVSKLS